MQPAMAEAVLAGPTRAMKIFFITKKLVGAMLMPLPFSLGLMVLGVALLWMDRWRRLGRYLVTFATVVLLVFSNRFVGYRLVHQLESKYPPLVLAVGGSASAVQGVGTEVKSGTASPVLGQEPLIVVLSGGASNDAELPVADRLNPSSTFRVVEACEIYRSLTSSATNASGNNLSPGKPDPDAPGTPRILLSGGGTVNSYPEAVPMQNLAESLGVPSHAILMETHSDDTVSEAKEILPLVGHKPFILVTSAFHMPRAIGLFQHLGMQPVPAPSNYLGRRTSDPFVMSIPPDTDALVQSEVAWHERLGMIWEYLRGQL